eukprot:TRINITY_DN7406_c0_g1_i8.p1 TRINITY_DN7406_c0_g1~~TRINITY_DN7406_c0_g1_i8.p1  ORF type:complete len:1136 (-),score=89.11 TRINITY_DN7406_c0_g1_i8:32-3037(-)
MTVARTHNSCPTGRGLARRVRFTSARACRGTHRRFDHEHQWQHLYRPCNPPTVSFSVRRTLPAVEALVRSCSSFPQESLQVWSTIQSSRPSAVASSRKQLHFSSTSRTLGQSRGSSYSVGNGWLSGLVKFGNSQGDCSLAPCWGLIGGIGLASGIDGLQGVYIQCHLFEALLTKCIQHMHACVDLTLDVPAMQLIGDELGVNVTSLREWRRTTDAACKGKQTVWDYALRAEAKAQAKIIHTIEGVQSSHSSATLLSRLRRSMPGYTHLRLHSMATTRTSGSACLDADALGQTEATRISSLAWKAYVRLPMQGCSVTQMPPRQHRRPSCSAITLARAHSSRHSRRALARRGRSTGTRACRGAQRALDHEHQWQHLYSPCNPPTVSFSMRQPSSSGRTLSTVQALVWSGSSSLKESLPVWSAPQAVASPWTPLHFWSPSRALEASSFSDQAVAKVWLSITRIQHMHSSVRVAFGASMVRFTGDALGVKLPRMLEWCQKAKAAHKQPQPVWDRAQTEGCTMDRSRCSSDLEMRVLSLARSMPRFMYMRLRNMATARTFGSAPLAADALGQTQAPRLRIAWKPSVWLPLHGASMRQIPRQHHRSNCSATILAKPPSIRHSKKAIATRTRLAARARARHGAQQDLDHGHPWQHDHRPRSPPTASFSMRRTLSAVEALAGSCSTFLKGALQVWSALRCSPPQAVAPWKPMHLSTTSGARGPSRLSSRDIVKAWLSLQRIQHRYSFVHVAVNVPIIRRTSDALGVKFPCVLEWCQKADAAHKGQQSVCDSMELLRCSNDLEMRSINLQRSMPRYMYLRLHSMATTCKRGLSPLDADALGQIQAAQIRKALKASVRLPMQGSSVTPIPRLHAHFSMELLPRCSNDLETLSLNLESDACGAADFKSECIGRLFSHCSRPSRRLMSLIGRASKHRGGADVKFPEQRRCPLPPLRSLQMPASFGPSDGYSRGHHHRRRKSLVGPTALARWARYQQSAATRTTEKEALSSRDA